MQEAIEEQQMIHGSWWVLASPPHSLFYCCRNESAGEYEKGSAGFTVSPLGVTGEDSLHMNTYGVRTQLLLIAASKVHLF